MSFKPYTVDIGTDEPVRIKSQSDENWYQLNEQSSGSSSNKSKKIPIPESMKWKIFGRDNFTCKKCGSRRYLTVDHVHPESRGGKADESNLQTLCKSCNSSKGNRV
jgi:hypothetical protein